MVIWIFLNTNCMNQLAKKLQETPMTQIIFEIICNTISMTWTTKSQYNCLSRLRNTKLLRFNIKQTILIKKNHPICYKPAQGIKKLTIKCMKSMIVSSSSKIMKNYNIAENKNNSTNLTKSVLEIFYHYRKLCSKLPIQICSCIHRLRKIN